MATRCSSCVTPHNICADHGAFHGRMRRRRFIKRSVCFVEVNQIVFMGNGSPP